MKFDNIKHIPDLSAGMEADTFKGMKVVNVDDESMNVVILTDKMIEENELREVSNPIMFKRGSDPTEDGLFSETIFGSTPKEQLRWHGYIDLSRKFIHPYVYEVLILLSSKIKKICAGEGAWIITDGGDIEEIKDTNDVRYNEDNTGIPWFIDNYPKISFKENDSMIHNARIELINSLTPEEMFISKWIVIPRAFRDVDISSGRQSVPEINYKYNEIMKNVLAIKNDVIGFFSTKAMFQIELAMMSIRKFGQELIAHKKGAFQTTILGKSIDRGSRSVISVPSLNGCDLPEDCIVDILHSGMPIAKCLELGYDFVIKWIMEFFENEFNRKTKMTVYRKDKKTGMILIEEKDIMDQTEIFTKSYIDKQMDLFIHTYGKRFETIKIKCRDGSESEMLFTGRGYSNKADSPNSNTISNRPMTWTDLFYMACIETLSDKHVYCTRYPLTDYFGTFPSRVAVLSTIKTQPVVINGKVYPFYPVIDLSMTEEKVATQFIDTASISNLYLDAIGGDYDGDTISIKMVYSIEANQEAEELLNSIKHYVSIQGNLVRVIGNEAYLTFYNMTNHD